MNRIARLMSTALCLLVGVPNLHASLTLFRSFNGNVGLSTDGWGSAASSSGTISASVPLGSTVLGAWLYTSYLNTSPQVTSTLNGASVAFGTAVPNPTVLSGFLGSRRGDVTGIVKPVIDGGSGGVYNFTVGESSTLDQDGEALVVVYSNPTLSQGSVNILDGYSAVAGDTFTVGFASPLIPSSPGFAADLRLGIGFSCCTQATSVAVNGTVITANAGNFDDGAELLSGSLISVGGYDDPYSSALPTYDGDHERYNIAPQVSAGSTSIAFRTSNPSADDNLFLAALYVATPQVAAVPEPSTMGLMGAGLGSIFFVGLRRKCRR